MSKRFGLISVVFSYSELIVLEDALRHYEQSNPGFSEEGQDLFDTLLSDVVSARRWVPQLSILLGGSQHEQKEKP